MTPEKLRTMIAETAEQIIADWIHSKYEIALAAGVGDHEESAKALERMRYLHYSEPWIPAQRIADAVRAGFVVAQAEEALEELS